MNTSRVLCNFQYQKGHIKYTASSWHIRHTDCQTDPKTVMAFCENFLANRKKKMLYGRKFLMGGGWKIWVLKSAILVIQYQTITVTLFRLSRGNQWQEEVGDCVSVYFYEITNFLGYKISSESNIKYTDFCRSQLQAPLFAFLQRPPTFTRLRYRKKKQSERDFETHHKY